VHPLLQPLALSLLPWREHPFGGKLALQVRIGGL
jgi:hypothetical protein